MKYRTLVIKAGVSLLAVLFSLISMEIALRVYHAAKRYSAPANSSKVPPVPLHLATDAPYLYGLNPAHDGISSQGTRDVEVGIPKPEGTFRILVLGDSLAFASSIPVEKTFPNRLELLLSNRDKVAVRHLLSHTAGLDEGLGFGGFLPGEKIQNLEEALTSIKDSTAGELRPVRVAREPGQGMSYGNANYAILQLLIEEVTHQSFADYMEAAVLRPLGMTKSSFDLDALASEGREQDLAPNFDSGLEVQPRRRYTATAAVALYATAEDMAHCVRAFTGENPVLKQETLKQMMTTQLGTPGTWGLGLTLFTENDAGGYVVGHDGGAYPSWGAMLRTNPATGNGFVLMVTGSGGAVNQLGHDWVYWETGKVTFEA